MTELECLDGRPSSSTTRLYEEGVTSLERELDTYSKILVACNKHFQMMHSLAFNMEQCQYLVDTLKEVIESSSAVLESSHGELIGSYAPMELEKHLLSFKLLLVLAIEIERFIKGCSQDAWVPVAMTLTDVSDFVSSIGFHLELCRVALSKKCGASRDLNLDQVANISKDVNEIVKTKTSIDKEDLLKKIALALPSLHGDEKVLASYLLQRLLMVTPIPSIPLPKSKLDLSQYLALMESISKQAKEGVAIGKGASATVFKAMWLGIEVAVKVFYGKYNLEFKKEVDVLARLCHLNITSMFCYTQERRKCSIFMELMDGDLFTLMQERLKVNRDSPFNIWEAVDIMHQIAEGGKYLHEQRIVHRDLKSMNILVKSVKTPDMDLEYIQVKITDFNVSLIKKSSTTNAEQTMNVGSHRWMAPELIQLPSLGTEMNVEMSNQSIPKYPYKCDIYSFAMVCYEILTGELPFFNVDNRKKMKAMILNGNRPKLPSQCPFQLRALIEKCWNPEPKSRPTFDDICRDLKYVKYILMTDTSSTSKTHGKVKKMMGNHADALEDFNKVDEHEPNDAFTLASRGEVKQLMGKYADALEDFNKADQVEPNNALTLGNRGEVKRLMGKYAEALEDFNKAIELDPSDAWILKRRGEVNKMMGKYVDALKDLNKANELEPNDPFTLGTYGEVKRLMGNYANALKNLNQADEHEPNNAFTLASRGEVKRLMGKYADALEDFNKADKVEPNNALTLGNRGEVKRLMDKYADALEDFNKANELDPNDAWILKRCGEVNKMMGKYVDALKDLNKADELEPNDALTLGSRGEVKRLMGNYEDALEDFNKANELKLNDAWILRNRGEVKKMMDKYLDALKDLNKANELEPNDALTLKRRGDVKKIIGRYADALADFNKANELEPNNAFTLGSRGEVKRLMGNYEDALEDFNKANELKPNDAFVLGNRGEVKRMMDKYLDALKDLNKANELEPNDALTLKRRGNVKKIIGRYADALADFNKANELEPNNAFTLGSRGEVKRLMGNYEDALEDFNKADELKPNDAFILGNRGEVKRMMDKYLDALKDLNKANELEPNDVLTLKRCGDVKKILGRYVDALVDFNKANELEPNNAFTLGSRGEVKQLMGNYEDALEDFNKADELQPNDAWIQEVGNLSSLTTLDLSGCSSLAALPKEVGNLSSLTTLDLSECSSLAALPKEVGNLSSLTTLDLSGCSSLAALPKEVGNFSSLTTLDLSGCSSLAALPKEVWNLSSLTSLSLKDCSSLTYLPMEVVNLSPLATLDLRGCSNLLALPKEVGNLSSLTTLNLWRCSSLTALPKEVGNLSSLANLDLSGCSSLVTLPKEVGSLSFLTTLNLRECSSLVALPKEVGNLSSLTTLNLEDCSILATLPKEVGNLSSLTTLNLWRCSSLATLPKEVGNLSSLTILNLRQCSSLATLPEEVGNLSSLTTLNLEDCSSLAAWPKEVEISSFLKTLNSKECSSKAQVQTTKDDEHVQKKEQEEAILTQFKAKYNLSTNFNNAIQEPLVKILSFLTIKGRHVLGSLLPWIQFCTGMFGQQVLSWNKGKVESKDLITGHFLGQGCSGIFYETTWSQKSTVRFARKDFPGVTGDIFEMEAIRLFELRNHPNVVKTFCWTVDNRSCSLVMEYIKDDLSSFMRKKKEAMRKKGDQIVNGANPSPFQLQEVLDILLQIVVGVKYIHDEGIYHGDLKPENVFLDWKEGQMLVKVGDFGLLETKRNTTLLSQRALYFRMIEWSAPELFEDFFASINEDLDFLWTTSLTELDPSTSRASCSKNGQKVMLEKADSYSFGLTSAYILGGEQMWPARLSPQELRKQISSYGLRPKLPSECPKTLASLIHACWNIDPTCRPTFSLIQSKMQEIIKEQRKQLEELVGHFEDEVPI